MAQDLKKSETSSQKIIDFFKQWEMVIAALVAAWAAIYGFWQQLLSLDPAAWSARELLFGAAVGAAAWFLYRRARFARASRLLDPDALKLDPQSPDQLVGRREDLRSLLKAASNPLVFLVSESGCGKSALLRAGVARDKTFAERFLPIYIDMSVLDWEEGPLRAVREEFSRLLPESDPSRGVLHAGSDEQSYSETFRSYFHRTHRRPLLLLDQFDDYQADPRHRYRFLPSEARVWRNAQEIEQDNRFWRVLSTCLKDEAISAIVSSRTDAANGLDSMRFHPYVRTFDLPRLERGLIRLIIGRLTDSSNRPVIANPEGGWDELCDRLTDDLETRGQVLPQQLKVVLGGLRTLPRLTPAEYIRAGRVAGLEAAFVADALSRAAGIAGLSNDNAVLQMVTALVDRTRQPPDKGRPHSTQQLAKLGELPINAAERVLSQLEQDEILRKYGNTTRHGTAWHLDHAYLVSPILAIERERSRWHFLIAERARVYAEATWLYKWSTFLPIRMQVQLLIARCTTSFRYGRHRLYALLSVARCMPFLAVTGVIAALMFMAFDYDAAGRIENKLTVLASDGLTDDTAGALHEITERGWVTRWRLSEDLFQSSPMARVFSYNAPLILRAMVRLDRDRLDKIVRRNVSSPTLLQRDARRRAATAALVKSASPAGMQTATRDALEKSLSEALLKNANIDYEAISVGILSMATAREGVDTLPQWMSFLRTAMEKTTNPQRFTPLGRAYAALLARMPEEHPYLNKERSALHEAIAKITNFQKLAIFVHCYAKIAHLTKNAPHASDILEMLRGGISKSTDENPAHALTYSYRAIAATLRPGDPRILDELTMIREELTKATREDHIVMLAHAYVAIASQLEVGDTNVPEILSSIREIMSRPTGSYYDYGYSSVYPDAEMFEELDIVSELPALGDEEYDSSGRSPVFNALAKAYTAFAIRMTDNDSRIAEELSALRKLMSVVDNADDGPDLAQTYAALAARLKKGDPLLASELIALQEMVTATTGTQPLLTLTQAYIALTADAENNLAFRWLVLLRAAMTKASNHEIKTLAKVYAALTFQVKVDDPRVSEEVTALHEAMTKARDIDRLAALVPAYAAMIARLRERDPRIIDVLAALRTGITKITSSSDAHALAESYGAVAARLHQGEPRVVEELAILRAIIRQLTNRDQLSVLGAAYSAVAAKVGEKDRLTTETEELLKAMGAAGHAEQLSTLARAYATVASLTPSGSVQKRDFGMLLESLPFLRSAAQCDAFAKALRAASQSEHTFTWDEIGLIYTAALLQPVCAGKTTRIFVGDFEELISQRHDIPESKRPKNKWFGNIWRFVIWAEASLPGFDPHEPNVAFLYR